MVETALIPYFLATTLAYLLGHALATRAARRQAFANEQALIRLMAEQHMARTAAHEEENAKLRADLDNWQTAYGRDTEALRGERDAANARADAIAKSWEADNRTLWLNIGAVEAERDALAAEVERLRPRHGERGRFVSKRRAA